MFSLSRACHTFQIPFLFPSPPFFFHPSRIRVRCWNFRVIVYVYSNGCSSKVHINERRKAFCPVLCLFERCVYEYIFGLFIQKTDYPHRTLLCNYLDYLGKLLRKQCIICIRIIRSVCVCGLATQMYAINGGSFQKNMCFYRLFAFTTLPLFHLRVDHLPDIFRIACFLVN